MRDQISFINCSAIRTLSAAPVNIGFMQDADGMTLVQQFYSHLADVSNELRLIARTVSGTPV